MKRVSLLLLLLSTAASQGIAQTCNNLVTNGDFEAGGNVPANFGFTSGYSYRVPGTNVLVPEGTYTLVANPNSVHNSFVSGTDHTSGTGRSMVINGSATPNTTVWEQTIAVSPNTNYYFSTWVKNVVATSPAVLQFTIGGVQIGTNFSATGVNQWQRFFATWNSGSSTSAVIRLVDQQTALGGNDFSIDDVFFTDAAPLVISAATPAAASCAGAADGSISVTATGGVAPYSYAVNGGSFTAASGNPFTITGRNPGAYSIVIRDACGSLSPAVSATVGAVDHTAPVVSGCPTSITVYTGMDGTSCEQVATWTPPTAIDNCSAVTVTSSHNPGDVFPSGTTAVTYTFSDASNNTSSCTFSVTVMDNTPPSITCPAAITVGNDAGRCGAIVTYPTPTVSDNCATCGPESIDGYTSLGVYGGHKYFLSNGPGSWSSFSAAASAMGGHLATVGSSGEDAFLSSNTTGPTWIGLTDQASEGSFVWNNGEPSTYTNWCTGEPNNLGNEDYTVLNWCAGGGWNDLPGYVDNYPAIIEFDCSGAVLTVGPASGSFFPVGTTPVTYTVTDAANNTSTCSFNVTVTDNTPPVVACKPYTLTLAGGTGTVTPANIDNGSSDNCGIASMSVMPNTFSCAQAGTTVPVVLTVTDVHGNSATCAAMVTVQYKPTCAITVVPCNNVYTGGVPTDIYLGYGPQCATIQVTPGGGGTGYSYSWSGPAAALSCTTCANPVFTPTAPGTYTYVVTVTNSSGCTTQCTVSFCVKDIRVSGNGNGSKVYICHAPPGNPGNANTLSVSVNAVASHLSGHPGDRLGACDQTCGNPMARMTRSGSEVIGDEVKVYPNPNTGNFVIELPYIEDQAVVTITDVAGKLIQRRTVRDGDGNKLSFNLGDVSKGIYLVEVIYSGERVRTKLIVQ